MVSSMRTCLLYNMVYKNTFSVSAFLYGYEILKYRETYFTRNQEMLFVVVVVVVVVVWDTYLLNLGTIWNHPQTN